MKTIISEIYSRLKSLLLKEEGEKFKPTVEWMQEWYDKMNAELFGGELGSCTLIPYTKGRGQSGRTLGYFQMTGGVLYNRRTRRMFKQVKDWLGSYNIEIDEDNFVKEAKPLIALNANYSATQDAWLNTLVHEMCHYYTYMNGYAPVQAHGREFKSIAARVASKSNGTITIQRLATAEEMQNYELDAAVQQKNQERKERQKSRMMALVVVKNDGQVRLITTTSEKVMFDIGDFHMKNKDIKYYGSCKDVDLIEFLQNHNYRNNMRSYRYWTITSAPWLNELIKYRWENYLGPCDTLEEALNG